MVTAFYSPALDGTFRVHRLEHGALGLIQQITREGEAQRVLDVRENAVSSVIAPPLPWVRRWAL
jgi:hypothetical protein